MEVEGGIRVRTKNGAYLIEQGNTTRIVKLKPGETVEIVPGFTISAPAEVNVVVHEAHQ
jgi:hypothetical protein